jgi:glycosyltransferase involved in cell wall biosynthesis
VRPALDALAGQDFDIVAFGAEFELKGVRSLAAGQLSDAELADLLGACDVFVFPSFYEGFGFPVLEAMASRKPIVLLDSELNRQLHRRLGQPNSFFFIRDFRHLSDAVRQAASYAGDWPDVDRLATDGWRRSAQEIAGLFRKLLATSTHFDKIEKRLLSIA